MNKIRFIIYIGLLLGVNNLLASDTDTLANKESMNLPDKYIFERIYSNSASTFFRPDAFKHGDLSVSYNYSDFKNLHLVQEGKSSNQYKLSAEGFTLNGNKAYWGKAGYRNFRIKDVNWNDVYDYKKLGPYLIADSIGGNSQGEEYDLSGGIAIQYGKWTFAGEAGYIAGHNYRKRDPRPNATSTDLYLQLSIAYNIFNNYQLGISGETKKYREKVNISVERDGSKFTFYSLRGFGSYSPKYTEPDASSLSKWLYEGNMYGANLFFIPENKTGLMGNASFNYSYIDANYSSGEKPYSFKVYKTTGDFGWQHWGNKKRTFIKLNYDYNLGKGIDRIFYYQKVNDVFGQYYLLVAYKFYTQKSIETKLSAGHEWLSKDNDKWITVNLGHRVDEERYAFPKYKMRFKRLLSEIKTGGEFRTKSASSFVVEASARYSPCFSSTLLLPEDNIIFNKSIRPNIDYWKADLWQIDGKIMYQYKIKNMYQLYSSLSGEYLSDSKNSRYNIMCSIGVKY